MNKVIHVQPPIIVKELAEQLGISRSQSIHDLAGMNVFIRVDQSIKPEVATSICKTAFVSSLQMVGRWNQVNT